MLLPLGPDHTQDVLDQQREDAPDQKEEVNGKERVSHVDEL